MHKKKILFCAFCLLKNPVKVLQWLQNQTNGFTPKGWEREKVKIMKKPNAYEVVSNEMKDGVYVVVFNAVDDDDNVIFTLTCTDNLPNSIDNFIKQGGGFTFTTSYGESVNCCSVTTCKLMCLQTAYNKPEYLDEVGKSELDMLVGDLTSEYEEYEEIVKFIISDFVNHYAEQYGINGILKFFI